VGAGGGVLAGAGLGGIARDGGVGGGDTGRMPVPRGEEGFPVFFSVFSGREVGVGMCVGWHWQGFYELLAVRLFGCGVSNDKIGILLVIRRGVAPPGEGGDRVARVAGGCRGGVMSRRDVFGPLREGCFPWELIDRLVLPW
jgi:hypothetical protein